MGIKYLQNGLCSTFSGWLQCYVCCV